MAKKKEEIDHSTHLHNKEAWSDLVPTPEPGASLTGPQSQTREAFEADAPVQSFGTDYDQELIAAMEANAEPGFVPGETVMSPEEIDAAKASQAAKSAGDAWGVDLSGLYSPKEGESVKDFLLGPQTGTETGLGGLNLSQEFPADPEIPIDENIPEGYLETDSGSAATPAIPPPPGMTSPYLEKLNEGISLLDSQLGKIAGAPDEISPLLTQQETKHEEIAKKQAENEGLLAAAAKKLEQPYKSYWARSSTGGKIANAIALALGTIGGGLTRTGKNQAAEIIINASREDARQQRSDRRQAYGAAKDRFQSVRRMLGDDRAAVDFRTGQNIKKARLKIEAMKTKALSTQQRVNLVKTQHDLYMKEKEYSLKVLTALNKKADPAAHLYVVDPKTKLQTKKRSERTVAQGGTKAYATKPNGKELSDAGSRVYTQLQRGVTDIVIMNNILATGVKPSWFKSMPDEYNDAVRRAVEVYGRLFSGAAIGQKEEANFRKLYPDATSEEFYAWFVDKTTEEIKNGDRGRLKEMFSFFNEYAQNLTGAGFDVSAIQAMLKKRKGSNILAGETNTGYERYD